MSDCAGKVGLGQRTTKALQQLWANLASLHRHPVWLANIWGFVPVMALLGVFTFWGPKVCAHNRPQLH